MTITTSAELEELIDSTVNIPTIPATLLEINRVFASAEGSAKEAATVIEKDPAIGAKVLRLVNSSVYALKNPVSSISLACSILGLKVIRNVVVQATVLEQFGDVRALAAFDPRQLWEHSFKTAVAARMIAARARGVGLDKEDAYTAGLMHDVGKMVLLDNRPDQFGEALAAATRHAVPLAKAEAEVFGFSHAHVGGLLAQRWKLSPELQGAIMYHHSPATDPEQWAKGFVIAAANSVAHRAAGAPAPWPGDVLPPESLAALGFDDDTWATIESDVATATMEI
ncbi:MAG TPA: HDOD domain-containing protein [Planctomycetota bacterium]|nr:HDOD domain-containing protein [Planctomycetota bacterium]